MNKQRIEFLDIAKGFGILLVVWNHANGPFSYQINQFHMPFFFIISGLVYKQTSAFGRFAKSRVNRLYIPFVFWNSLAIWIEWFLRRNDFSAVLKHEFLILFTLSKADQYFGATWFLGALFLVSILYKLLDTLLSAQKYRDNIILALFIMIAFCGFHFSLPYAISRTLILSMFFALGVFANSHKNLFRIFDNPYAIIICTVLFIIIGPYDSVRMAANEYSHPILFIAGSIFASHVVLYLCKILAQLNSSVFPAVRKCLVFFGKRSMDIVIWHLLFFRIGIILQMYLNGEAITVHNALQYYPLYDSANGWFLIYFAIGILIPILWCNLLRIGPWGKCLKRIHAA